MDQAVNENFKIASPGALSGDDIGPFTRLPAEAPLAMPAQNFATVIPLKREKRRRGYWVPRAAIFVGAAVLTTAFAYELFDILAFAVMTPLQFLFLVLSTISFAWIAVGSLSAALGFLPLFAGEKPDSIVQPDPNGPLTTRTALLFPVYHEDPARIAGTIEAMTGELKDLGREEQFQGQDSYHAKC